MSWITTIWSMAAGASLTFACIHLIAWLRERDAWANLFFSISAIAAAVLAMQESAVMRAQTPADFSETLRWMHLSVATLLIAIVWFIYFHLKTGRLWLAWLITSLRLLTLIANFFLYPNATFQEIHALREVFFLGETLSAPVGEVNPWRYLIHLTTILLLIYVLDAAYGSWKLGRVRSALVLGASILMATILGAIFSGLMVRGILPGPFIALIYLIIVLAMAFELSADLLRSNRLAGELQKSEERMRLAARAADLGFWEWDVIRDKVWVSEVGKERTGISGAERAGFEPYLELVHPDDRESLRQAVNQSVKRNEEFQSEFRITGAGGGHRWVTALGQVELGEQGQPSRLRGVSMDISARKQVEVELQRSRNGLALAQRVSAMGQLSSALTHELNQPLGAILRNAEAGELFLQQDPPNLVELQEILADIKQDDQRAAAVIDRMRSLLKHGEVQFESIAPQQLIEQVTALLNVELQARNVKLRTITPHGLPKVRGDRIHLQQVLLNLLLNSLEALDATPIGARQIEISAIGREDGRVEFAVRDTGTGIDTDRLLQLFEPFFTTKTQGTGLGLAISRTVVEAHGGRIYAENNPDGGACIRIELPGAREQGTK